MHASAIVDLLVPALTAQGFAAHAFANSTPNGYGHKIALRFTNGNPLGSLVIYAGKKGPRYVTSELHAATPDLLGKIEQAWSSLGLSTQSAPPTTPNPPLPPAEPGTIELWVDGACLQQPDGLKFGWAFVLRRDGIELQQGSGRHIRPDSAHHRNVAAELEAVRALCLHHGRLPHHHDLLRLRRHRALGDRPLGPPHPNDSAVSSIHHRPGSFAHLAEGPRPCRHSNE